MAGSPGPDPTTLHASEKTASASSSRRVTALLAEDNRADALIIQEAIEVYGLPVDLHIVEDGQKAFDFIQGAEDDSNAPCPQVLILDLNLPKRTGKEVLQRVRRSVKCKAIPVLVITSSDSPKDRAEVADLGAHHYFRKSSSYDEYLKVGEVLRDILQQ
jgi:CheY-like chemotaxis protein